MNEAIALVIALAILTAVIHFIPEDWLCNYEKEDK